MTSRITSFRGMPKSNSDGGGAGWQAASVTHAEARRSFLIMTGPLWPGVSGQ